VPSIIGIMVIDMQEERLDGIEGLEQFLAGTAGVSPRVAGGESERQAHVRRVLGRFGYAGLSHRDKGVVVRYLQHTSGIRANIWCASSAGSWPMPRWASAARRWPVFTGAIPRPMCC
jgi:hypothetical protein